MIQGILKVVANMNARASAGEMADDIAVPSSAVSVDVVFDKKAASISEFSPINTAFSVPRTASLANAPLMNAMKVCQPIPKNLVTGSINVPIRYSRLLSTLPSLLNEST